MYTPFDKRRSGILALAVLAVSLLVTSCGREDLYEIPGTPYSLYVDRYFPTGGVVDTVLKIFLHDFSSLFKNF